MSENDRKKKMISIRISETEYEALRKIHRNFGARNVSDFARLSMERVMSTAQNFDLDLAVKIHEIDDRLKAIEARVAQVAPLEKAVS